MKLSKLRDLAQTFWRRLRPVIFPNDIYSREFPSEQTAADLFRGEWTCLVPKTGVVTGQLDLFRGDDRPIWFANAMGGLKGRRVLELGPLEGAHTYQLENLGAEVLAIESNKLAFLRCLIVKNTLLLRARFLLGDFVPFIAKGAERFDAVFASGVLYHMQNPVEVLRDLCRVCDHLYLWTHYYDHDLLQANPKAWKTFSSAIQRTLQLDGLIVVSHEREYASKFLTYFVPGFCGGMHTKTYWIQLDDIKKCLATFGFEVHAITVDGQHANGPCASIYARRKPAR